MRAWSARTDGRKARLQRLNRWRNAIAHQDFSDITGINRGNGRIDLWLANVRAWRAACDGVAETLDDVVFDDPPSHFAVAAAEVEVVCRRRSSSRSFAR